MTKLNLTPEESIECIKGYIHDLDDIQFAIQNLTWELQPTQINLLQEAGDKLTEIINLLQQVKDTPEVHQIR